MSTDPNQLDLLSGSHLRDQSSMILDYLKAGNRITPLQSLQMFGCFRLGARIWDLKKQGHKIESTMVKLPNGKRVAEYKLKVSDVTEDEDRLRQIP